MKKIIPLSAMLYLFAVFPANAQISVQAIFGEPQPAYVAAPEYVSPAPIYPTYAVEGARYHGRHFRHGPRGHVAHGHVAHRR